MADNLPNIVLIDDDSVNLQGLHHRLRNLLPVDEVEIRTWIPSENDVSPREKFVSLVDEQTTLVVTDYDLTPGVKGLFGLTIVGWCQGLSVPVGDFSRGNAKNLPAEPNLFELRVPLDASKDAKFIASTFKGFRSIAAELQKKSNLLTERFSLSAVLASILNQDRLESQFSLYMTRLGSANSGLVQKLRDYALGQVPNDDEKIQLLIYVLGHVMINSIMKFPGPILSEASLAAYFGTNLSEAAELGSIFKEALYAGPFSDAGNFYWREQVDAILNDLSEQSDEEFESVGDFNRQVVQRKLGRELAAHGCKRCGGKKGGYWCPFMLRPICERSECSVASSSWIPQGATHCRVERDFYDEWAPILGL